MQGVILLNIQEYMRIILLGAPGTGKGTHANFIMKKYNIQQISVGDMLRTIIQFDSEINQQDKKTIKDSMYNGKLIDDNLIISIIKKNIMQTKYRKGFLLDGFPRTVSQANLIKDMKINLDYIFEFKAPNDTIINRILGRLIHESSGRIYHTKFNPPKIENKDDLTGEYLIKRKDDKEEIIRKRLIEYYEKTSPLINFYQKEADMGNIKYIKIDSTKSITEIQEKLKKILS